MLGKVIIQIISPAKGSGKTKLGTTIVNQLKLRGYFVTIIKHAFHGIDVKDKDSDRYHKAGASDVVLVSDDKIAYFTRKYFSRIEDIISSLPIKGNIILIEGFKDLKGYPKILVLRDLEKLSKVKELSEECIAIVVENLSRKDEEIKCNIYSFNDVEKLVGFLIEYSLNKILNDLPNTNCGYCGYGSCREFAETVLRGQNTLFKCPVITNVKIIIDGKEIPLTSYPKLVFTEILKGYIRSLKGVPKNFNEIKIRVTLSSKKM